MIYLGRNLPSVLISLKETVTKIAMGCSKMNQLSHAVAFPLFPPMLTQTLIPICPQPLSPAHRQRWASLQGDCSFHRGAGAPLSLAAGAEELFPACLRRGLPNSGRVIWEAGKKPTDTNCSPRQTARIASIRKQD